MVGIAGRVLFLRNGGGLCFVQLPTGDGTKIQGMISKKEIGADSLKQFKQLVDLGDHLYLRGRVIASKTGELSVFATEWAIASNAPQPLPALHKDLDDTRTRKPYIGMIADEKVRNMVRNLSAAVASLRRTFDDHDFLEVETPMLQTIHGGAAARPFTTHMNAFDLDLYLRIAPELFLLKRCLVGGIDRVFEINRDFRNEGATPRTLPRVHDGRGLPGVRHLRHHRPAGQGARAEDRDGRVRLHARSTAARRHRIRFRRRLEDHQHV